MTRSAQVTLDWADGTYPFALKIEQLTELQEKCDAGPWYIQWALESAVMSRTVGSAPPKDLMHTYVTEPLRLGLIGGGMPAVEAMKKIRAYAGAGQMYENMAPAFAVLSAALQGVPEDEPEKSEAGQKKAASRSRAGKSGSRKSLASAPQPD